MLVISALSLFFFFFLFDLNFLISSARFHFAPSPLFLHCFSFCSLSYFSLFWHFWFFSTSFFFLSLFHPPPPPPTLFSAILLINVFKSSVFILCLQPLWSTLHLHRSLTERDYQSQKDADAHHLADVHPTRDSQTSSWNHHSSPSSSSLKTHLEKKHTKKQLMPSSQPLPRSSHEFWRAVSSPSKQFLTASWNLTNSFHYRRPVSHHLWPLQPNLHQTSHTITPLQFTPPPSRTTLTAKPSSTQNSTVAWLDFPKAFKHNLGTDVIGRCACWFTCG